MKPLIAVTIGDFNGIGPEVALKTVSQPAIQRICTPVLVGPLNVFEHIRAALKLKLRLEKSALSVLKNSIMPVVDVGDGIWADVHYGTISKAAGKSAGAAIERAVELCVSGKAHAMVTAPTSKEALNLAGFNFPGQTEMVAMLSRSQRFAMMLVSKTMRVGLVTIHIPIRSVSEQLSVVKIKEKIAIVADSLRRDFAVKKPSIAVLALNPHAGEKGLMGTEDDEIVSPAVQQARAEGHVVDGPFPADAFFGKQLHKRYGAVLAMYHDQGLIPLKMTGFEEGVNFSAGLNIIRTSPDHGTAFDIAGKNKAAISSMVEAVKLAVSLAKNRNKHD